MQPGTQHNPLPPTLQEPAFNSVVPLWGHETIESIETRFPQASTPPPGKLPAIGPYVIEAELGRGGMGVVYRARDTRLDRIIALKMILRAEYSNAKDLHRFQVEAMAVAKLKHPNIVQVYDVGTERDVPFMALEYIEQGTLLRKTQGKPQEARYAAYLVAGMADGIQHAHEHGILHRDLKPANILLRLRENDSSSDSRSHASMPLPFSDMPVISDFGLAKKIDSTDLITQTGTVVGTPNYMAPEQAAGNTKQVGTSSDIYSLGAILYELLTGKPPFQGTNPVETLMQVIHLEPVPPRQLQPKTPVDLETICLKCLQKDPERRYASAGELAADLRRYLRDEVITARPAGAVERLVRWCRRHPAVAGLLALAFFLLIAGASVAGVFAYQANQRATQLVIEKENAARNLQRARTIIRQYLTDVDDDPTLREMISVPLKQKLLSRAMPLLQELIQETGDTPELITEQAKAQWLLGNIHNLLGKTAEAESSYRTAIEALVKLQASELASLEQLNFLGTSHMNLGKLLMQQGRFDAALQAMRQGEELATNLMTSFPESHVPKAMLAHSKVDQAELARIQGHYDDARTALKQVSDLMAHPEKFGEKESYLAHKIALLMEQAQIEIDTGYSQDALKTYQQAYDLTQQHRDETGWEDDYLQHTSRISYQMSCLNDTLGKFEEGITQASHSIECLDKLIAANPLKHSFQLNLATSFGGRAMLYTHAKKWKEAEADVNAELKLMEQLTKLNPTFLNRKELARAHSHLGNFYFFQQRKECEASFREAARQFAELAPIQPGDSNVKLNYANMHMSLGNMMLSQMRFPDAIKEYEQAHAGFQALVKLCPDFTIHHVLLGGVCCNLGNSHLRVGHKEEAAKWLQQGIDVLKPVLDKEPGHGLAQNFYRNTSFAMVDLLATQSKFDKVVEIVNDAWKRPIHDQEKPLLNLVTKRVQDRFLLIARQAAEAGNWNGLQEYAELLCRCHNAAGWRLMEMLKLCDQGLKAGDATACQATATALIKQLQKDKFFDDADNRKEFQSNAAFEQVRKLDEAKALVK